MAGAAAFIAVGLAVATIAPAVPALVVAQSGPGAPAPAYSVGAAFDAGRQRLVLFGGDTRATGALGDTWVYDGVQWREMTGPGPPPRSTHAMVSDERRQRVVLFGGADGSRVLGDTWEWDGRRWIPITGEGPSARTLYGLAYDSVRARTVLFGGTSLLAPNAPSHGDTWEFDGTMDPGGRRRSERPGSCRDGLRRIRLTAVQRTVAVQWNHVGEGEPVIARFDASVARATGL